MAEARRVGPYELGPLLGQGGMGRVFRARDSRLGRDVAVKLLTEGREEDPGSLRRFEQEAKAVAALNHPNVVAIHDVGVDGGVPYLVSELLEGSTLRDRLAAGPLPWRKALELAVQIAAGLDAAHERGIVHRDLKPANVFITKEGRAKILDFGLARVEDSESAGKASTLGHTASGAVLGTVGYMAPEQVRGRPADERSDLFALGVVLHEMLSGRRPFDGATPIECGSAILNDEPASLPAGVPTGVARVVRRCLEKPPDERFQSARDLGFALEALMEGSAPATGEPDGSTAASVAPATAPSRRLALGAAAVLAIAGATAAGWAARGSPPAAPAAKPAPVPSAAPAPAIRVQALTFRRGAIAVARFASKGEEVIYSASWDGDPLRTFLARPGRAEGRPLFDGHLQSVATDGELAFKLPDGTLARASALGDAPRPIATKVVAADWIPGSQELALVRVDGPKWKIELPAGHVVFEGDWRIERFRVSRDGKRVAFSEVENGHGKICVVDRAGTRTVLNRDWASAGYEALQVTGMAWSPDDREVWFTGSSGAGPSQLQAIDLEGKVRQLMPMLALTWLVDVAADGRVLLARHSVTVSTAARRPGDSRDRELSWFDGTTATSLSADGSSMVFSETAGAGGRLGSTYARRLDGTPAVRLADWAPMNISPDGTEVLTWDPSSAHNDEHLTILPIGVGEPRRLPRGDVVIFNDGAWFPDGKRLVFCGRQLDGPKRCYVQDLDPVSEPHPVTPAGTEFDTGIDPVSPDGRWLLARDIDRAQSYRAYPLDGGEPREIPGLHHKHDQPIRWASPGQLYVARSEKHQTTVHRVDLQKGTWTPMQSIVVADLAGLVSTGPVLISRDGRTLVYSYTRVLSQLFLVEGLR